MSGKVGELKVGTPGFLLVAVSTSVPIHERHRRPVWVDGEIFRGRAKAGQTGDGASALKGCPKLNPAASRQSSRHRRVFLGSLHSPRTPLPSRSRTKIGRPSIRKGQTQGAVTASQLHFRSSKIADSCSRSVPGYSSLWGFCQTTWSWQIIKAT